MFNNPPKFDELFANVAESNKKWFENLVNVSKGTQSSIDNPLLDAFQSFTGNTQGYLESQTKFYQEQLQNWSNLMKKPAEANGETKKITDKNKTLFFIKNS